MGKKNKKKVIAKRRTQAKIKKQKRLKNKARQSVLNSQYIERPAISAIDPPQGFRAVSMSQGMVEYAKPLMDYVEKGILKDPNEVFQLAMPLWNYDISKEQGDFKINKKDIIKQIEEIIKLNAQDSAEFFDMMIRRKEHLFPKEIQPNHPMTMFIRQEEHYLISEFNYASLNLSEKIYIPVNKDNNLVQLLNQMDDYIDEGIEYDEWEDHYFELEKQSKDRFEHWLKFKGVTEYSEDFPYNVGIYLNFIYCYMHEDIINLRIVTPIYIEEFFVDFILRKVTVEPHEYITWPPALKLFYSFLNEIGYFESPEKVIKLLDEIEPVFLNILKARYS